MGLMKRVYTYCQLTGHHIDGEVKFNRKAFGMAEPEAPTVPRRRSKRTTKDLLIGEDLFQIALKEAESLLGRKVSISEITRRR